jgi:ABC-2 type transport system permease protein
MNQIIEPPSNPTSERVPSPEQVLRRLFLTLFLRGRAARGLDPKTAPKSVGQKLALTLLLYALFGCLALTFRGQSIFMLSVCLHGLTFVFLGMFVASSAGEILFNKEEADILAHRPIRPRALLWAKIRVLVEVSLWLAAALNLAGLLVGAVAPGGDWRFPVVHAASTALEALFAVGLVVTVYQLCLRWFGRERLDGIMTTAQVVVSIAAVAGGQIVPQLAIHLNDGGKATAASWWMIVIPPAWFAGFDDALAGSGALSSWLLGLLAIVATASVMWIAFGKLAGDYEAGLRRLNETTSTRRRKRRGRGFLQVLVDRPPLRWCLREPLARASFLLTAAYLVRDRDVKLRVYPALAPMLIIPFIMLLQELRSGSSVASGFGIAFASTYVGLVPMMGLTLLQYSTQWQAADIFRAAPMAGPAAVCHGARWAVQCLLTLPMVVVFGLIAWLTQNENAQMLLLLPGLIALPVYSLLPNLGGKGVPLSTPIDSAKSAGRGLTMIAVTFISMALSGIALVSKSHGWFWWFIAVEASIAIFLYVAMQQSLKSMRWPASE